MAYRALLAQRLTAPPAPSSVLPLLTLVSMFFLRPAKMPPHPRAFALVGSLECSFRGFSHGQLPS